MSRELNSSDPKSYSTFFLYTEGSEEVKTTPVIVSLLWGPRHEVPVQASPARAFTVALWQLRMRMKALCSVLFPVDECCVRARENKENRYCPICGTHVSQNASPLQDQIKSILNRLRVDGFDSNYNIAGPASDSDIALVFYPCPGYQIQIGENADQLLAGSIRISDNWSLLRDRKGYCSTLKDLQHAESLCRARYEYNIQVLGSLRQEDILLFEDSVE